MSGHHEKEYSLVEIAMNLFIACLASGFIIAAVYFFTAPTAIAKAEELKNISMQNLVKEATAFKPISGKKEWFEAQKDGKTIAIIVPSESKGFSGAIKMIVAVTPEGQVIDYDILAHNETPGLGDGANKEGFKSQVRGKTIDNLVVTKDPNDKDHVQAMTGATISSRAVIKGIKEAAEAVKSYSEGK